MKRLISLFVFKSNMTKAGGAICLGFPKISANPESMTHNRSHSSTRIRNVDIIDELSTNWPFPADAFGAFVRPALVFAEETPSLSTEFASQLGYGINIGLESLLSIFI